MIEVRLLGEVEVAADGRLLRPGGAKERALLAVLALRVGELVPRELLIERLWEQPPAGAAHALAVRLSALRKTLRAACDEELVVSRPGGYLLALPREQVDVYRFERLLTEARQLAAAGDVAQAEELLSRALSLWRGVPLADIALEPVALAEAPRLEELRLSALEERAQARLALGRDAELVAELEPLVRSEPLREPLRALLMLALYRCGRQADALDLYQQGRRLLVEELGIEPSRTLKQLQQQILAHDPELESSTLEPEQPPRTPVPSEPDPEPVLVPAREQRKVVTVLFCDVSDSTELGERLDPEALRAHLARYFERMKAIVDHHGGTVEKFIGDAVMAAFGIPRLHEDDASRACRAAIEMQAALPELGLAGRIGVATGEVVTGTEERLATGDPVNLAARLEQAAQPGEILIAASTLELVRDSVEAEPLAPLQLKGKAKPVSAYRLAAVAAEARARSLDAPLVGRSTELQRLQAAFTQAVADRSCQLFTILGPAGIGKSRLTAEFAAAVQARVVRGRCLSYGDAITYAPVVEILSQLEVRPAQESAAAAIGALLGENEQHTSPEEIAWAFRRTLETAAATEPLVCLFDDLHWGDAALLDLIEHIADYSRETPILLLCLARPELHDHRPSWAGGKTNATTLLLEPLSPAESHRLLDQLSSLAPALRDRIVTVAEGNPLFLEQMRALAEESDDAEVMVPTSIQALLAARLDQLDFPDRMLLEHAAIEGKHFHQAAVAALTPAEPHVQERLRELVRRELLRPAEALLPAGDAYRFRHQLIRDAAYNSLPKAARADLHQAFAAWLGDHGANLVELDELVGHHLEQACRYRHELGQPVDSGVAAEAQQRLESAGRHAVFRSDYVAAAKLFRRAHALLTGAQFELALEHDLAWALINAGESSRESLAAATERARATHNSHGELSLRIVQAIHGSWSEPEGAAEQLDALSKQALPLFASISDEIGLQAGHAATYYSAQIRGLFDVCLQAAERSLVHLRNAGRTHWQGALLWMAGSARLNGSTPLAELLSWLEEQTWGGNRINFETSMKARALAMLGRFDESRSILGAWQQESYGYGGLTPALLDEAAAEVELLAGNATAAVSRATEATRHREKLTRPTLPTWFAPLAEAQYELGLLDQAEANCRRGAELAPAADVVTQTRWRQIEAKILARRGTHESAERLARQATAIVDATEWLPGQADAYADLAETLTLIGKNDVARQALEEAAARYERKGHLVGLERAQARLTKLETELVRGS